MQYFYLVAIIGAYDEPSFPIKVFMQYEQALKCARKYATKIANEEDYFNSWQSAVIYRQPMTSTGQMELINVEIPPFNQP